MERKFPMICGDLDLRTEEIAESFPSAWRIEVFWPTAGTCRDYHKALFGWPVHTDHHGFKAGIQDDTEFLEKWEEEGKKEGGKTIVTVFTYWNPRSSSQKMQLVTIIWKMIVVICLLVIPWKERAGFRPVCSYFLGQELLNPFILLQDTFLKL